jgi:uncharacterized HAD superfamily protein
MTHAHTKPIVVLDVDGVLFQTPSDAVLAANKLHGTTHKVEDIFDHDAHHNKELFVVDGVDQFHLHQSDIAAYTPVPGSVEAITSLAQSATLIALTSRNYDKFYDVTKAALHRYFGTAITQLHFTTKPGSEDHRPKGQIVQELGGALLIDDSVEYCKSCSDFGIPAILFGQPYNQQGHDYPAELRANDWPHAESLARQLLQRIQ